jgi:hypothetical protein
MASEKLYLLVRNPDDRWDRDGIQALTRQRVLERFPATEERYLQDQALLVMHPTLHPACSRKLLPAANLYTALREESEHELFGALIRLGATEVELEQRVEETERNRTSGEAKLRVGAAKGEGSIESREEKRESVSRKTRVVADPLELDLSTLEQDSFFSPLVFNRDNASLRALFDTIRSGRRCTEYRLEFHHTIERSYALEIRIKASYASLFTVSIDFEREYARNRLEKAALLARFGEARVSRGE